MRMDNGPELVSLALAQWAEEHGVMLEFIKPGQLTQGEYRLMAEKPEISKSVWN